MIQPVALDGLVIQMNLDFPFAVAGKLGAGNTAGGLQLGAYVLGRIVKRGQAHVAIHLKADHAARAACQGEAGRVGGGGQGGDGVHGLLNILIRPHHVHAINQRGADHPAAFAGAGGQFIDAFHIGNRGLDRQQQTLLDVLWRSARIADGDLDDFRLEFGKHLFFDRQ